MRILILLFCITSFSLKADYSPLRLWEMALKADKIVYGEITELRENDYTLKIESSITGDSGTIIIQRFQDWTCAVRWAPYKVGQKVVVFLQLYEGKYNIMSGGGEGEMEVSNGMVKIESYIASCDIKKVKSDLEIKNFMFVISEVRRAFSYDKKTNKVSTKPNAAGNYKCTGESLYWCLNKEINNNTKSK